MSRRPDTRAWTYSAAVGLVLFASLAVAVFARDLVERFYPDEVQPFTSWFPADVAAALVLAAFIALLAAAASHAFFVRFDRIDARLSVVAGPKSLRLAFDCGSIVRASAVILLLWLPIIVLMYPTGLTVDTFNQLYQFDTVAPTYYPTTNNMFEAEYIDHHPVFDTLLYGAFWWVGGKLGSQNAGLFALVLLQSLVLAAEMGALCCYLQRIGVPWVLRFASLVFAALFPFFAHYAATVLKDVTYLTFFIPWSLMWFEIMRTRGCVMHDARFLVAFMLLGGLCIISKKLGVYVLLPCLVVLAVALRGQRARVLASSAVTLLLFCGLLPAAVYPAIGGVEPGGLQEVLGPAMQQVTATYREDPESFSQEELDDIGRVMNLERSKKRFELFRSDHVKSTFKQMSATRSDIVRFMGIWAEKGLSHPLIYGGTMLMTSGMLYVPFIKLTWYDDEDLSGRAAFYESLDTGFSVDIERPSQLLAITEYLAQDSPESLLSDLPLASLFFTEGFYGGWVPLLALAAVLYARRRNPGAGPWGLVLALAPTLVSMAFLLVTPVASPRYVLPFLFTAPLLLGWAWHAMKSTGGWAAGGGGDTA